MRSFSEQLEEPIRTVALVCGCFGLRISEALAPKWSGVDWLNGTLLVERGISDATVNLHDRMYGVRKGDVENVFKIGR